MIEVFLFQHIQQMSQVEWILSMFHCALDPWRRESGRDAHFKSDHAAEFLQRRRPVAMLAAFRTILGSETFIFQQHHPGGGRGFVPFLSAIAGAAAEFQAAEGGKLLITGGQEKITLQRITW